MSRVEKFVAADEEHAAFTRELGNLTLAWSDVEAILFKLLKHHADVTWPVARALFSGTRARAAINFIRAIAENTAMDELRRADLEETFKHILDINAFRDFIVHHTDGSMFEFEDTDPTKRYISDKLRVSRESKTRTYLVGSSTLAEMRDDCEECCWRLHPNLVARDALPLKQVHQRQSGASDA
jgi:hypothetical protein